MLTKKELGIPWEVVGNDFIVSNKRTIGVCKTREDADSIIHAVNSYHALVEALENIRDHGSFEGEDAIEMADIANQALLATHTQEEAPDSPVSVQTPEAGDNAG